MNNELFNLQGKVAVITGGTGTLGSAMARGLKAAGARVIIIARTEAKAQELAGVLNAEGGEAFGLSADVLVKKSVEVAVAQIVQKYGQIDILINAAGGNSPDATVALPERSFFDLPLEALQWVFNLNLLGTFLTSQVIGNQMANQKHGVILNISSMAAFQPLTRVVAYASAKAAINNFTQWLAVYMATTYGPLIRVNALAPGFFIGEQNRFLLIDQQTGSYTARGQKIIEHTPMGRFGEPEELIGTMLWLVSDAARFVTGIVVPVDGGFSAFSGV